MPFAQDLRLPPWFSRALRSSGILHKLCRWLFTDVLGHPTGPTRNGQTVQEEI